MHKIERFTGVSTGFELAFVESGGATPEKAMTLGIYPTLRALTIEYHRTTHGMGVQRSRKAIHDWVQKADLQPEPGHSPNQIAFDETVIRINDPQF